MIVDTIGVARLRRQQFPLSGIFCQTQLNIAGAKSFRSQMSRLGPVHVGLVKVRVILDYRNFKEQKKLASFQGGRLDDTGYWAKRLCDLARSQQDERILDVLKEQRKCF